MSSTEPQQPTSQSRDGVEERLPMRAIVILAAAAFASALNLRVSDPLLAIVAKDFSSTIGQASAIVAGFTIGYGLLQLLFGPVGDRFGKYRVTAITAILTGIATALAATATTLDGLVAWRFAAGALAAATIPLAFAWIGDAVPFARRQAVLARFLTAQMSGIVLGQAAGGYLGDVLGWRWVMVLVGAIHVVAGVAMVLELRLAPGSQPKAAPQRGGPGAAIAAMIGLMKRPWIRVMLASVLIEGFAFYGSFAYIGADLHGRFGTPLGLVGLFLAAFGGGAIAYALAAPMLLGRLGERGLALAGGVVLAVAFLALAWTRSVAPVPIIMIALGFGFYMIHNTLQANATQMAPEARGLGVSLFALALFLGQALGVMLAAPLVDQVGAAAVYPISAAVLLAISLWFRGQLRHRPQP